MLQRVSFLLSGVSFLRLCLSLLALVGVALTTTPNAQAQDFIRGLQAYSEGDYATAAREWQVPANSGDAEEQFSIAWWSQTPLQWDTEPSTFSPHYRLISGPKPYDTSRSYPMTCRDPKSLPKVKCGTLHCMWVGEFYTNRVKISNRYGVFPKDTLCVYMFHTQGKPEAGFAYFTKDEEDTCEEISQYAPHYVDAGIPGKYERTSEYRDLGHRKIKCEQAYHEKISNLDRFYLHFIHHDFFIGHGITYPLILESRPEQCQGGGQHQCCQNLRTLDR